MTTPWAVRCPNCQWRGDLTLDRHLCPECQGAIVWDGSRRFDTDAVETGAPGLWRYGRLLPISLENAITLGEGMTPLSSMTIDGVDVRAKLDSLNPTGSFKDRGVAVMISVLRRLGASHAVEDSSGNAGASVAAYAARAGMGCSIYAPAHASSGKLAQARAYGADVVPIEGTRERVAAEAIRAAATTPGATYASHNLHPMFIEGVKTWAFEVWEQLGRRAPDAVVVPAGSGSLVLGAWLGFSELMEGGAIGRVPRIYAAQPAACAPIVAAVVSGDLEHQRFAARPTLAEGASIVDPIRGRWVLAALRASGGGAAAIDEERIISARELAAHQGIYIEPTSALAVAGAQALIAGAEVKPHETIVIHISGHGLKSR